MGLFQGVPLRCGVCGRDCSLHDVVDFNRSCEEARGKFLEPAGVAVYYARCSHCGFCFAPEFSSWSLEDFEVRVYNGGYVEVDPDYLENRPRGNAEMLLSLFGERGRSLRHLDYGGGSGVLARLLREAGWQTVSYDPFVDRRTDVHDLGQFDLITAFEVFEHVPHVPELMEHLRTLRGPQSLVLFSTLLSDGNIAEHQRLTWPYAAPRNGHVSLFSKKSLALLAQADGVNFGSFSNNLHVFFEQIPPWARHVIRTGA